MGDSGGKNIIPAGSESAWFMISYEPRRENTYLREFPTRSDSNLPAQL